MSHPEHLDEGLLHALLDGEIPSSELAPIQDHLARCPACRARLDEARGLAQESGDLVTALDPPAGAPAARPAGRPLRRTARLAWAASLIGAAGLGYAARGIGPAAGPAPAAPPATPPAQVLAPDTGPARPTEPAGAPAPPPPAPAPLSAARDRAEFRRTPARQDLSADALGADTARAERAAANQAVLPAAPTAGSRPQVLGLQARESGPPAAAAEAAKTVASDPEPIEFADAIRRLGGALRLVEGLVPLRLEARGPWVRVIYGLARGELVLEQRRVNGALEFSLRGPPGLPEDSLALLRARVRD